VQEKLSKKNEQTAKQIGENLQDLKGQIIIDIRIDLEVNGSRSESWISE
jgi:hypothetical protein